MEIANTFEDFIRKKEIEMNLLSSRALENNSSCSLYKFSHRIREFEIQEKPTLFGKIHKNSCKALKKNRNLIYTLFLIFLILVAIYLLT
jgi:hypothetical protein